MAKAGTNLPQTDPILQELFDHPPLISQSDLRELAALEDRVRLAQIDFEAVAAQITEMLLMDSPVESGRFGVRLKGTRLELFEEEAR